ncbi:thioredoxin family protein [Roseateles sp. MS654]|uniref:thioredoxin family protein n=1 Tax=Roseateles sp. MS654 TaxID=3412685 RepID=UPI003C2D8D53
MSATTRSSVLPLLLAGAAAAAAVALSLPATTTDASAASLLGGAGMNGKPAPAFDGIQTWINSPPLSMDSLRGKVVLVDFWTYTCINCLNQLPYVKAWHEKYKDQGLVVVGVHSPEYDEERSTAGLKDAIARLGIRHAVAQDNDFKTWKNYSNRFWPALYLIDKQGKIVYSHFGEGAYPQTEAQIQALLKQQG